MLRRTETSYSEMSQSELVKLSIARSGTWPLAPYCAFESY